MAAQAPPFRSDLILYMKHLIVIDLSNCIIITSHPEYVLLMHKAYWDLYVLQMIYSFSMKPTFISPSMYTFFKAILN